MEHTVQVERHRASVAALHALDPFAADHRAGGPIECTAVWACEPTDAAIVLGSRQSEDLLDAEAVRRAGLVTVRRRSGGGAVLVDADVVWIDLVVPAGSAITADVRRSMIWAGERWRAALIEVGVPADRLTVHTGGLVDTPWSPLVCFAGLGPGEVLLDDHKLVGLSQRRTRRGVRIQGQLHRSGSLARTAELFRQQPAATPDPISVLPDSDVERLAQALAIAVAAPTDSTPAGG